MRYYQLGVITALVATSTAFLLPPTVSSADTEIVNALPFEIAAFTQDRTIDVDCTGCPVLVTDIQGKKHIAQGENVLRLNFSVSIGDENRLFMNDAQIYPINPQIAAFDGPPLAEQLVKTPAGSWELVASTEIGYGLIASRPSKPESGDFDLLLLKVEVVEVANTFVKPVDAVVVKVLETPNGKLMIVDVEKISIPYNSASNSAINNSNGNQECTTILCKWRAIIFDKLAKARGSIKGCTGKARPGAHGSKISHGVRPHGLGRPRPAGPHAHHRHHNRHGSFARIVRSIVLHIFIPIMIGVVVGVTTSLVGMVVGHLIVFVWRTFFRRGSRGQYTRVLAEEEAKEGDEITSLAHQGPPPTYEDAPAYEEAVADEKSAQ